MRRYMLRTYTFIYINNNRGDDMKMIKMMGLMLLVLAMFNTDVLAIDYDSLTTEQRASVDRTAAYAGYTTGRSYYDARILAEIAEADEKLRAARRQAIHRTLGEATDDQLTQIEAILFP